MHTTLRVALLKKVTNYMHLKKLIHPFQRMLSCVISFEGEPNTPEFALSTYAFSCYHVGIWTHAHLLLEGVVKS